MTIQVFGAEATVSYLNRAFSDTSPANAIFANQVANAKSMGDAAFANAFGASFSGLSNAVLSKQVLTNIGVLPSTDTSVMALEQALTDYFAAFGVKTTGANGQVTADTRGYIVLQLATILAGLENATGNQAVYTAAANTWNNEVTAAFTYSNNTANTSPSVGNSTVATGTTYTLDINPNTIPGTANDDTINGTTLNTLSALDSIDGGAGTDSLTATIGAALPSGLMIKNVENITINATTVGNATGPVAGALAVNATTWTGVSKLSINNSDSGATSTLNGTLSLTAPTTTTSINASAVGNVTVIGGAGTAAVTSAAAIKVGNTAAAAADANKFTAVTANGGTTVDITDNSGTTAGALGSTLTTVSLNGNTDAALITANGLTTLNLNGLVTAAKTTTITAAAATRALTINTNGVTTTGQIKDSTATTLTVANSGVKSSGLDIKADAATAMNLSATGVDLTIASLVGATGVTKAVNISGDALVTITADTFDAAAVITSTNTKGATITQALEVGQKFVGGAGADTITLKTNASAASSMGDGNDTVNLPNPFVFTGGSIDGGAGTDTLVVTGGYASALSGVTGFEVLGVTDGSSGTYNATGFTGLTVAALAGGAAIFNSVAAASTLTVTKTTSDLNTTVNLSSVGGTTDALTISLKQATTSPVAIVAGGDTGGATKKGISAPGVENLTVESNGTVTGNAVVFAGDNKAAQTLTLKGAADLAVFFSSDNTGAFGKIDAAAVPAQTGVSLIDGSAATGKLTLDTSANFTAANAGVTIKTGSAVDTITLGSALATLTTGAGNDKVTLGVANTSANIYTTWTDATAGDQLATTAMIYSAAGLTKLGAGVVQAGTAVFQDYLNAAVNASLANGGTTWFNYNNNTYVVIDAGTDSTSFVNGQDFVIQLNGVKDLSNSTITTNVLTIV